MSADAFDTKRITMPFSALDVFVYLIPGSTFFISIYLFEQFLSERAGAESLEVSPPFGQILWIMGMQVVEQASLLYALAVLLVLLTLAYVAGHVISSISSFWIDRSLIRQGHQYPYALFLGRRKKFGFAKPKQAKEAFYRGLFFWPNLALIAHYSSLFVDESSAFGLSLVAQGCIVIVVGLLLMKVYWHWLNKFAESSHAILRLPNQTGLRLYKRWRKVLMLLASGPYDILALAFSSVLSAVRQPLTPQLLSKYQVAFHDAFGIRAKSVHSLHYWFVYMYLVKHAPELHRFALAWHYQYEFARNLGTGFYIAAIYCGWLVLNYSGLYWPGQVVTVPVWISTALLAIPILFALLAFIMLSRYYYIYVCYYNRFLFRAFVFAHGERLRAHQAARHERNTDRRHEQRRKDSI